MFKIFHFLQKTCTFLLLHFMVKPIIHWWTLRHFVIPIFCDVSWPSLNSGLLFFAGVPQPWHLCWSVMPPYEMHPFKMWFSLLEELRRDWVWTCKNGPDPKKTQAGSRRSCLLDKNTHDGKMFMQKLWQRGKFLYKKWQALLEWENSLKQLQTQCSCVAAWENPSREQMLMFLTSRSKNGKIWLPTKLKIMDLLHSVSEYKLNY